MKRALAAAARRPLGAILVVCLVIVGAGRAWADDYVTVRGVYYREASTRVIQPMVELLRESPTASTWARTSSSTPSRRRRSRQARASTTCSPRCATRRAFASASGSTAATPRCHTGTALSPTTGRTASAASLGTRLWDDTATLRLSLGRSFDTMSAKGRTPDCRPRQPAPFCTLNTWFAGVSYSQVLSPVALAQISYETAYLSGFQGNLYRMVSSLMRYEYLPEHRMRNAIAPRIAYYLPGSQTGFQLHYRFYFDFYPGEHATPSDPWFLIAHTIEARLYQQLTPTVEIRLLLRYYRQNHARFWCDAPRPSGLARRSSARSPPIPPPATRPTPLLHGGSEARPGSPPPTRK